MILVVSHSGFEGGTSVLTAPVPGDCIPFTLGANKSMLYSIGTAMTLLDR